MLTRQGDNRDPNAVRILGIVTRTHDSGLALLEDGVPTFVLEEERFNREKHTRKFPFHSLKAAFDDQGMSLAGVDVITTPWHVRSLWRMMFDAVRAGFPASLNLVPPSARPTQSTLIVMMPNGLRWGLLWHSAPRKGCRRSCKCAITMRTPQPSLFRLSRKPPFL